MTMVDIGRLISLIFIGGGLLWLFISGLKGKEVDRRIIFLFIFLSVATPILFPITFGEKATPVVKAVFDKVESLPEGSRVLISFDFDPAMAPEVQPMANAITRHSLTKGHKVIFMSLFATGQALLTQSLRKVVGEEFPELEECKDYVNVGFKAGNEGVLNVIVTDFKKMFPTDVNNVPYDSIEVFDGIKSCKDIDLIVSIGGGMPGVKEWVLFVGDPGNVPVAAGVAAVVAPQMYPYYPEQILGILGGVKGAAEYESELIKNYPHFAEMDTPALRMMGPQTLAHMVIMIFIVIGNVLFFVSRRKRRGK
ncbi:MAG: hypothetical protein U9N55_01840 [candidate division Zixibacteria bacterium]|nr:hypothetical protein [candidate division Zixibacteria bacterium]